MRTRTAAIATLCSALLLGGAVPVFADTSQVEQTDIDTAAKRQAPTGPQPGTTQAGFKNVEGLDSSTEVVEHRDGEDAKPRTRKRIRKQGESETDHPDTSRKLD